MGVLPPAGGGSSCDDLGFLTLRFTPAEDDQAPREDEERRDDELPGLGYRIDLERGELPEGAGLSTDPRYAMEDEGRAALFVTWIDGGTDDQEALDFALSVVAVDAAGNESEATEVVVSDPGGGCSTAPGASGSGVGLGFVLGALALRRHRWEGSGRVGGRCG